MSVEDDPAAQLLQGEVLAGACILEDAPHLLLRKPVVGDGRARPVVVLVAVAVAVSMPMPMSMPLSVMGVVMCMRMRMRMAAIRGGVSKEVQDEEDAVRTEPGDELLGGKLRVVEMVETQADGGHVKVAKFRVVEGLRGWVGLVDEVALVGVHLVVAQALQFPGQ